MDGSRAEELGFLTLVSEGEDERALALLDAQPTLIGARTPADFTPMALEGCGVLHLVVHRSAGRLLAELLRRGAPLDTRNAEGRTALHDAIEYGSRLADVLIDAGADVDVCCAAILGRHAHLSELLEFLPELANDRSTQLSPLGWAAFGNQVESARRLLDAGARMDDAELSCAAAAGHTEVGRYLIERGADPNELFEANGLNALHAAAGMRYTRSATEFASMLLDAGADPSAPARDGRTALAIARECAAMQASGHADGLERDYAGLIALLEEHGAS